MSGPWHSDETAYQASWPWQLSLSRYSADVKHVQAADYLLFGCVRAGVRSVVCWASLKML